MARTYSTQLCSIWDDPGFRALSSLARDTYFMLATQPEIDAAGCMALTVRRWSKLVTGVAEGLRELAVKGFVAVDEDTEEVWAAPFAESDGGYKHSKRVHAVIGAANAIRSDSLRKAAWKELTRLGVSAAQVPDRHSGGNLDPVGSATDGLALSSPAEHPSSLKPQEGEAPSEDPSPFCSEHPKGTEKACGPCKTAGLRFARWAKEQPRRAAAAKAARDKCPNCQGSNWIDDDDGKPLRKCNHKILATIS